MADLTPKQEAFALAFLETGNAAEAYRRAYDVKAATQHSTIYSAASHLLADPKISTRVAELQKQAADLSLYTVKDAFEEYEAARKMAMADGVSNPSAAVAAVNGKVKLFGLDRPGKLELTGENGGPIQTQDVTAADVIAARLAAIKSRASGEPDA